MDKTAVELLAVQLDENEDVRIWSKGLGPFTDMAQSALQRKIHLAKQFSHGDARMA